MRGPVLRQLRRAELIRSPSPTCTLSPGSRELSLSLAARMKSPALTPWRSVLAARALEKRSRRSGPPGSSGTASSECKSTRGTLSSGEGFSLQHFFCTARLIVVGMRTRCIDALALRMTASR